MHGKSLNWSKRAEGSPGARPQASCGGRGRGNGVIHHAQVILCHAIGRHDVDGVAERPQQHARVPKALLQPWSDVSEIARVAGFQIERRDGAGLTDALESRMLAEAVQLLRL